ncbi:MAG: SAM-dependent methyltransferase [Bacteroidales bacterium]|nr:SAM-dependent methyltransferase [Bacteroidales bacterium]
MKGKLYLIPTTLGDDGVDAVIPAEVKNIISRLDIFIVENIRSARRYIRKVDAEKSIDGLTFFVLNKHTDKGQFPEFLAPLKKGRDVGLITEAGVPGIADPGEDIVRMAHKQEIRVVPLVGPSSVTLALMGSGLNGQHFAFNGYLPIQSNERIKKLKMLEKRSQQENHTQIFMETPYRNNQLLKDILEHCRDRTLLCIASNITLENEKIQTKTIKEWRKAVPDLNKQPAIFLLHSS